MAGVGVLVGLPAALVLLGVPLHVLVEKLGKGHFLPPLAPALCRVFSGCKVGVQLLGRLADLLNAQVWPDTDLDAGRPALVPAVDLKDLSPGVRDADPQVLRFGVVHLQPGAWCRCPQVVNRRLGEVDFLSCHGPLTPLLGYVWVRF